jgi:TRAP-type C4-dicarboxylate transport system permease small subunit
MRILAIVLLAVGILALVYGGFTYTTETHRANIGPLDFSITEKERVNVPVWVGVVFSVVGAGLLLKAKR